ncbi:MAG: glutamate mutase L, partial [Deltaproteobacteria bacterium]|nr:glutamate mutase L [Deltaproteobacteria bacterium]
VDAGLARSAVEVAVERHAGTIQESWGPDGAVRFQYGKDLTGLRTVIGTGGIFAFHPRPGEVLKGAVASAKSPLSLKPRAPELYIDRNYVLYGVGLLSTVEPEAALAIGRKSLVGVDGWQS